MKLLSFKRLKPAPLTEHVSSLDAFDYFHRTMKALGWQPETMKEGPQSWLYFLWTCMTTVLGIVYLPTGVCATYFFYFDRFTANEFLTSLQVFLNALGSTVKTSVTYSQIWRIRKMQELNARLDEHCVTLPQREILHNAVAWGNRVVVIIGVMYLAFGTSTLFSAVVKGSPPWQIYNPLIDWRASEYHLWLASFIEYFVMCIVIFQQQESDTYPIIFAFLFRAHLAILKDRVEHLRENTNLSQVESYEQLVTCIKDHKLILECCDILRPMTSISIFTQFMLIGIVMGVTVLNIFYFYSGIWTALANLVFLFALQLETFPFCINCELLIDDCQALTNAIFHSNWLDADRRYKSTVLYFLHSVQKPIQFKAGAILPISVQSNITVAKFAFSIITVFNQMNLGDKLHTERVE